MKELKTNIKNYIIVKYVEAKLEQSNKHMSKQIPWIKRKGLYNTIQSHCRVLLDTITNKNGNTSLRQNKFIVDSILKYTLGRSENLLLSNKNTKDIKSYMQLNSYIVYDEIMKGYSEKRNNKSIIFNIEKQLSGIQERIDSKDCIEDILNEKINV